VLYSAVQELRFKAAGSALTPGAEERVERGEDTPPPEKE